MPYEPDTAIGGTQQRFPTTRYSLVHAAAGDGRPAREALDAVVAVYWKPVYKHVRLHWRRSNEEAKDLVQGFFTALIEQDLLGGFDPEKGRLRTYLRTCLDRFILKQDESAGRWKRGGREGVHLDFESAEREIADASPSAEDLFYREWQREIFALALADLREHCRLTGKDLQHRIFEEYDLAEGERPGYAALAAGHRVAVTDVTNYLAWARRELRRLLLERLQTVTSGERESRAELRLLLGK